ncbi:hypothetical protein Tco_1420155 [Tanacetum coccineum]
MNLSASSSTKNPPRKLARTNVIDISSNKSSPLRENNFIATTITTTLALPPTQAKNLIHNTLTTSRALSLAPLNAS